MLLLLESNFNNDVKEENLIRLTVGLVTISSILYSVSISNVAKDSFITMLVAIKVYFTPTVIKVVIITTALLALTTF